MQQLLTGTRRLPEFQKSEAGYQRPKNRFFNIPSDWKLPQIKEFARESTSRNRSGESITVLSCSKHRGFVESAEYFGKQIYSDDTSNYKVIHRDEFGFPSNHIEEGSIGLLTTHDKGMVSPIYTVFKVNSEVLPVYLFALFKTETYRHIFEISTNGSVDRRGSLRWNEFNLIRVPLPSIDEQRAIAAVLETADGEIRLLEAERDALAEQKKGLMQKLLTGEKRLPAFQRSEDRGQKSAGKT
jgi:type I restriction enzyme S subunit